MLTAFEDPPRILAAIRAGADGYLLKRAGVAEILEQLRVVASGGSPMTPGIARSVLDLVRAGTGPSPLETGPDLSERERAVLGALVRGLAYKQVAADLDLSIDTVRTYIRRIYAKLQVHSATEAVARAVRERLTD
jgi:DNA-binding NarL/FixJ family response regulator